MHKTLFAAGLVALSCAAGAPTPPLAPHWRPVSTAAPLPEASPFGCGPVGLTIEAALPDPVRSPDREGEWVRLENRGPWAVSLTHWSLESRARTRVFIEGWVPPGGRYQVGGRRADTYLSPLRLTNTTGSVRLVDPCGVVRGELTWHPGCVTVPPGWSVTGPSSPRDGPRRAVPGWNAGGCGQT